MLFELGDSEKWEAGCLFGCCSNCETRRSGQLPWRRTAESAKRPIRVQQCNKSRFYWISCISDRVQQGATRNKVQQRGTDCSRVIARVRAGAVSRRPV